MSSDDVGIESASEADAIVAVRRAEIQQVLAEHASPAILTDADLGQEILLKRREKSPPYPRRLRRPLMSKDGEARQLVEHVLSRPANSVGDVDASGGRTLKTNLDGEIEPTVVEVPQGSVNGLSFWVVVSLQPVRRVGLTRSTKFSVGALRATVRPSESSQ